MSNYPLTDAQVKQLLGVDDFSEISEDQIRVFVSEIPRMDKDVAIKAIEQFPAYSELAKELTNQYFSLTEKASEANNASVQQVLAAYEQTLELMASLAQRENISDEDRQWFAEKAVEVADKMAGFDLENKSFLKSVLSSGAKIVGGVAVVCATILGFMFFNSKDD